MTLELTTLKSLRDTIAGWKHAGDTVALVPTMGALHRGHLALVSAAKKEASRVVISIFVNPTQFGPNEDFDRYPRPLARDLQLLNEADADAVWLPTVAEMYPQGFATTVSLKGVSEELDGAHRPGHFDGVATVVSKLLLQVTPNVALFGEKDYQQLCVIERMVNDLNIDCRIIGVPTVREADGLALSSRNQYLTPNERAIAPLLQATLQDVAAALKAGAPAPEALGAAKTAILAAGFASIDYLELCDAATLAPASATGRLLVAATLGKTRLIDNIAVG